MPASRDAQEIVAAITKNTRAIESLNKTIEKVGKAQVHNVAQMFSGDEQNSKSEPLYSEVPQQDSPK